MQQEKIRIIPASMWKKHPRSEERSTCVSPRMRRKNAFTLIELLVVVLILGILTAIALPQYQKAIERTRNARLLATLDTFVKAQKMYYLEHGTYATTFDQLDVPAPTGTCWAGPTDWHYTDCKRNADFMIRITKYFNDTVAIGMAINACKNGSCEPARGYEYMFTNFCFYGHCTQPNGSLLLTPGLYCKGYSRSSPNPCDPSLWITDHAGSWHSIK